MAELADAQVSEACDGDIVEVQVLSSAPEFRRASQVTRLFDLVTYTLVFDPVGSPKHSEDSGRHFNH